MDSNSTFAVASRTALATKRRRVAWSNFRNAKEQLTIALARPRSQDNEIQVLKRAKADAEAGYDRSFQLQHVHERIEQQKQTAVVKERIISALSQGNLLDTIIVSLSSISSANSPVIQAPAEASSNSNENENNQRVLARSAQCQKEYQHHFDRLEVFRELYQREKVFYLTTYTNADVESFEAFKRTSYGTSYEEMCAREEGYIDTARQNLERATARVLAAGLQLPTIPPPEQELPTFTDKARGRVRKFQRNAGRGSQRSYPRESPVLPSRNPIRNLPSDNSGGDAERLALIRQYEPKRKAMRDEAGEERRKRKKRTWGDRVTYSKGAFPLRSPTGHMFPRNP